MCEGEGVSAGTGGSEDVLAKQGGVVSGGVLQS